MLLLLRLSLSLILKVSPSVWMLGRFRGCHSLGKHRLFPWGKHYEEEQHHFHIRMYAYQGPNPICFSVRYQKKKKGKYSFYQIWFDYSTTQFPFYSIFHKYNHLFFRKFNSLYVCRYVCLYYMWILSYMCLLYLFLALYIPTHPSIMWWCKCSF